MSDRSMRPPAADDRRIAPSASRGPHAARHAAGGRWCRSASSSATASGSSCSATSSCSPPSSRPTRCWSAQTAGGPSGRELFDLRNVAIETAFLLLVELHLRPGEHRGRARSRSWFYGAMAVTFVLGAGVPRARAPGVRRPDRARAPARRAAPSCRPSLRWSDCHGLHVTAGLLWLLTMMAQVFAKGFRADILRRMLCFSLFWHALDIIWVGDLHRRVPDGSCT